MATKKRTKKKTTTTAPKKARKKGLCETELARTFSRAVAAGNRPLAARLASKLRTKANPFGVYSLGQVSVADLKAFEALNGKKGKR
jgi:hypothetical protein